MSTFRVKVSLESTPSWGGPKYPSVEFVLANKKPDFPGRNTAAFTAQLASELEIDTTVNKLIGELEGLRVQAKRLLHDYADWMHQVEADVD